MSDAERDSVRFEKMKAQIRRGEFVRESRQTGKTRAILEVAHEFMENGEKVGILVCTHALIRYTFDLWGFLFPEQKPPVVSHRQEDLYGLNRLFGDDLRSYKAGQSDNVCLYGGSM